MEDKIKQILLYYKQYNQKNKSIEELSELIRAIVKDDRNNVIEEIADVEIMIAQLKMIYLIEKEEVENIKRKKIEKVMFKIRQGG